MQTIKTKKILTAILLSFAICSCTEEIKIELNTTYPRLVIYGELTTDAKEHEISLTKSMNYFEPKQPEGISGATVTLHWDDQSLRLTESNEKKGVYLTPPDFSGIEETDYRLTVENVDLNGDGHSENYEATSYLHKINHID